MSKKTYSKKINKIMQKKIEAIENLDFNSILAMEEDFEVALCLAYMTLSKEKIIKKDIKNSNRINRLSQMVETSEIDKLFKPGFAKEMPNIIFAKENNNLWILDNIRDSIMHGAFDIDEKKKIFLINNKQFDRELIAEVPFSWFVAYAKNDILSKKQVDNYTIKGFYYNKLKENRNSFSTNKELINNILYRINITGSKFNVKDIETRIKDLFDIYSKVYIDDYLVIQHKSKIEKEKIKYNEKYLTSFYIASDKVKKQIEQEFPKVSVEIFIDNRKHKLINKALRRMPHSFKNYNLMFNEFNKIVTPKSTLFLNYLINVIEHIKTINLSDNASYYDIMQTLNFLLNGTNYNYTNYTDQKILFDQNLKVLKSLYLNVYGLLTLVINHEDLYNSHFLNQKPIKYGVHACNKSSFLNYAQKRKSLQMKLLENEISLFSKNEQINKCKDDNAKRKIQQIINDLILKKQIYENEFYNLNDTMNFEKITKYKEIDYVKKEKLEKALAKYYEHFTNATTIQAKNKIKKIISKLLDEQILEEAKYTYGYCFDMKEVLTIIRNCFSHIGRISIGKDNGGYTNIFLNDYDNDNKKSGEVICNYANLTNLLSDPYILDETKQMDKLR